MHPLKDARVRKLDWIDVARETRRLLSANADSSAPPGIRTAEALSGYSTNQLRRMVAGLQFLEELQLADPKLAAWVGVPRFSIGEMLGKLWRQDQAGTLAFLRTKPILQYASLYALHKERASQGGMPVSGGKRSSQLFQEQWLACVKEHPQAFAPCGLGTYAVVRALANHPYCKPAFLIKYVPLAFGDQTRWIGIDFIDDPVWRPDSTWRRVMMLATETTFLDHTLIFVAAFRSEIERSAFDQIRAMADDLGITNLNVIPVQGNDFCPVGKVEAQGPMPDRRAAWKPPRIMRELVSYTVLDKEQ